MALPEVAHRRIRSTDGCLCCGNAELIRTDQVVSGFLARRAWGGSPEIIKLAECLRCGFRFFERGLSAEESERYYRGYRNHEYQRQRQRWEPFYTPGRHAAVEAWAEQPDRIANLRQALARSNTPAEFRSALDHGGGRGQMLAAVEAARKAVFDPSGEFTLPEIEHHTREPEIPGGWHIALCCQVLEHVSDPLAYLRRVAGLLAADGWLYVEVPPENWTLATTGSRRLQWLSALCRVPPLMMAIDMLSAASRIRRGRIPAWGVLSMREHINFFTVAALNRLLERAGFDVVASGVDAADQSYAVARKSVTGRPRTGHATACGT